jgi:ABC-2 type transport system permease protein
MAAPVAEVPEIRRSRQAEWSAAGALFALTVRQATHGRRMLVLIALYLLPVGLAILLRSLSRPAPSEALEFLLILNLVPHGLAPLTALLYASGVIRDEVEDQTLTYLLLRSVPRWAIYVVRLVATMCVTSALVIAATVVLYLAVYAGTPELGAVFPTRVLRAAAIMALGQVGYCALFGFLGLAVQRSLVVGMGYIAAVEGGLASIDFVVRKVTVVFYVRTLFLRWLDPPARQLQTWLNDWGMDLAALPSARQCVLTIVIFGVVATLLTALWFARREFRVKTPGEG